jgi:hypothetical protein
MSVREGIRKRERGTDREGKKEKEIMQRRKVRGRGR